ncbi:MAG: hypothetical protein K0R50_4990 [Eubacterium sp.]|nr:hypothetical protein [Eubacterium sp.]
MFFDRSRHVESVTVMTNCGQNKKWIRSSYIGFLAYSMYIL